MAVATKCPKCDSSSFELNSSNQVKNCRHLIHFIQCSACGAAIGLLSDRHNNIFEEIAKKLGIKLKNF